MSTARSGGWQVLRQLGDEVCYREELEALAEVEVVFRVEEDIGALLLKGDLAQGDWRAGHVLRKALHGSRIRGIQPEPSHRC
jgi:hypothetical protein